MSGIGFELLGRDGQARRGRLTTAHGTVETPAFMPVGTAATVKAMWPDQVKSIGAEIVLANTYHLMLRPGAERVRQLGGLHRFMNWPGPILTDSGGFQVMSLAELRKIEEKGVTFRSHIDGRRHELTPERSIAIQHALDANITMCFDECTPYPCPPTEAAKSMRLSMRWAARCRQAFVERPGYGLFGIVQGSTDAELREESAKALTAIGFDGYAVGGLAVGEGQALMFETLDKTLPFLPPDRPRYLMGVGTPSDIVGAVMRGIDMFDCVMPTRSGRTGRAYIGGGTLNIRNARHAHDPRPVEEACDCATCRNYSRGYIHHLFKAEEMLGPMLLTLHNLRHYQRLMAAIRKAILEGRLAALAQELAAREAAGDIAELPDPLAQDGGEGDG